MSVPVALPGRIMFITRMLTLLVIPVVTKLVLLDTLAYTLALLPP